MATENEPTASAVRRGRPPTGDARTPAQRKALQRERDRTERPVEDQSLEALLASAGRAIQAGEAEALKGICKEMQRRAKNVENGSCNIRDGHA